MIKRVIEILSGFTEVKAEDMNEKTRLAADLGLNSLDVVNLVVEFEDEFDIEIPDENIRDFQTIGDILRFIENQWYDGEILFIQYCNFNAAML